MKRRILIFDDEHDVLFILKIKFESLGYEVHIKDNCVKVVDVVREVSPSLIIMDNWIPDIGGVEATKLLKKDPALKTIPVIMCTASKDANKLAEEAGANACIEKPFDLNVVVETVEQIK